MTAYATYAGGYVSLVIEKHKVWKPVYSYPFHRFARGIGVANFFESRAVLLNSRVAIHADFGLRNRGVTRLIDRVMAVITVHAKVACVQLVGVGNGLNRLIPGHDDTGVSDIHRKGPATNGSDSQREGSDPNVLVGRFRKDERH